MKYLKYGALGVLILALAFFVLRSCVVYDNLSVMKGKYEKLSEMKEQEKKEADERIAASSAKIGELEEKIAAHEVAAAEREKRISRRNVRIASLKKEETRLKGEVTTLETITAQRDNFKLQRDELEQKFTLAEQQLAEKDGIITNWELKYGEQVKITNEWIAKYMAEEELNQSLKGLVKLQERKVKSLKLTSRIQSVVNAAAGAALVYLALKD